MENKSEHKTTKINIRQTKTKEKHMENLRKYNKH